MEAIESLTPEVGTKPACEAFGVPRASVYRLRTGQRNIRQETPERVPSVRALSIEERQEVLDLLHEERFVDKAPHEVYATLLDEGQYFC